MRAVRLRRRPYGSTPIISATLSTATHTCCERCQTGAPFVAPPPPTDRCRSVPGAGSGSTATRPASGPRGKPATGKSAGGFGTRALPHHHRPPRRLQLPRQRRIVPTRREVVEVGLHPRLALPLRRPHQVPIPRHRRGIRRRTKRKTRANPKPTPQTGPRPAPNRTPPALPLMVTPRRSRRRRRA